MSKFDDIKEATKRNAADQKKIADATTWKPEEGEERTGVLLDGKWTGTQYGDTKVLFIEDEDGEVWTVWASNKMLSDAIDAGAPKVGSMIGITYDGKKKPVKAGGYEYQAYFVTITESDHEHWRNSMLLMKDKAAENDPVGGGGNSALEAPF